MKKRLIQLLGGLSLCFVAMLGVDLGSGNGDFYSVQLVSEANAQIVCPGPDKVGGSCHVLKTFYNVPGPYGPATCQRCEFTGYMEDYCDPYLHGTCEASPSLG